jgi:hypothetical protein
MRRVGTRNHAIGVIESAVSSRIASKVLLTGMREFRRKKWRTEKAERNAHTSWEVLGNEISKRLY